MSIKKKVRKTTRFSSQKEKKTQSSSKTADPSSTITSPLPLSTAPAISAPPVDLSIKSPTGVAELDSVLSGGFPKGSVVLVSGNSGTGKTILSLQWLFDNIKNFGE
mgnify:CR=1 FL=1